MTTYNIPLVSRVFWACVALLHWLARKLDPYWPGGMDYIKINVILFCVLLPVVLLASLGLNLYFILS